MISKTVIVKDSEIGENTDIYEFANVYGAIIGDNCKIESYVEVQNNVRIGNNVIISSHSFICTLVEIEDDVIIATPVASHFDLTIKALESGKHVLVEKPMATTVEEVQLIGEVAERKSLITMVGHTFL